LKIMKIARVSNWKPGLNINLHFQQEIRCMLRGVR
jgi:hypothetical protein